MKQQRDYKLALYFSRSLESWADDIHCFRMQLLPGIVVQNSVNYIGFEIVLIYWRIGFGIWKR